MSGEKVRQLMHAALRFQKRGEYFEWGGLTHISKATGIPRPTTYRYLEKLVSLGLMKKERHSYHQGEAFRYRVTDDGLKYLGEWKMLPIAPGETVQE